MTLPQQRNTIHTHCRRWVNTLPLRHVYFSGTNKTALFGVWPLYIMSWTSCFFYCCRCSPLTDIYIRKTPVLEFQAFHMLTVLCVPSHTYNTVYTYSMKELAGISSFHWPHVSVTGTLRVQDRNGSFWIQLICFIWTDFLFPLLKHTDTVTYRLIHTHTYQYMHILKVLPPGFHLLQCKIPSNTKQELSVRWMMHKFRHTPHTHTSCHRC